MRQLRLLAVTGTAAAALALTACGGGTGTKDEGASGPTVAQTGTPKTPRDATTTDGTPADGTDGTSGGESSGSGTAGDAPGARTDATDARPSASAGHGGRGSAGGPPVLCNGANTTVTAQPLRRPLNHLLLTVRNTGGRTCELPYYPVVRFGEMQWVPQADRDTQPQAVVSLEPGASAYAGVLLSAPDGSGAGGMTSHSLTVAFQGMTPNSSGGPSATPPLPAKGVYYDSSLKVTYWQQELDAISSW
ncbi:DUF4232 domain-containing protein [Streptomyces sp. SID486]|uniref:DUF4232 domain-containing protein n=1 Tax=Streptomyces sp. SID486 TaxID=2690264 RepID=UPI00136F3C50|nr:DUF4232 domain-containing protein [Streptomyces sp. SID486]MYW16206.1 DUF4232 domain-containing protein [Streptomyces sp. SID2955]MYX97232.1 DUF4232 domain-containing protein [Streptomyces sp. SID486]